jgi:hypothetical protein
MMAVEMEGVDVSEAGDGIEQVGCSCVIGVWVMGEYFGVVGILVMSSLMEVML